MENDYKKIKEGLASYLMHGSTHISFDKAVANFPESHMNKKISDDAPHTPWMIVEHMRISQHDMADFILNPNYKEMTWPDDFWPKKDIKADKKMWTESVKGYQDDIKLLLKILDSPGTDLIAPIPWGEGQNVLKEILQIVDHTSYHLGQLIILRRAMGIWKEE